MSPTATPARRARARRDPAVLLPPAPPRARSDLATLELRIDGVPYLIGPSLADESEQPTELTMEGASTWTLTAHDPDERIARALGDEELRLAGGVRVDLDDIEYVLQSASGGGDEQLLTMTFVDEVAWRLMQYDRYLAVSRAKSTDGEFIWRMVQEASRPPMPPMRAFIPELLDRLPIAAPQPDAVGGRGRPSTGSGFGDETITVKGTKATAAQRRTADAILTRAQQRRASRRVMIGEIMAATQESRMGLEPRNGIHLGPFHQSPAYGTAEKRLDAESASDGFLDEWKRIHGSVRTAPGNLAAAVEQVQRSGLSPAGTYGRWEQEATKTVDAWLGTDSSSGGGRSYPKSFQYTRGERNGQRETSWDAAGRIATDEGRNKRRWAALNTLHYVSDAELRAAAPAVVIHGDEPWLVTPPAWEWGATGRSVTEVTFTVLADRWDVLPGAVVILTEQDHLDGRYLVSAVRDDPRTPDAQITIKRPAATGTEPAHDIAETNDDGSSGSRADRLLDAAKHISSQGRSYLLGGGHGKPLDAIKPTEPLDCSSAVSLVLKRASMFDGATAIVSGAFASSWGKPGKGRTFTVWANATHVWIEFHDAGTAKRFDTSPYGSGDRGARVRTTERNDQARFTARHWPGA